MTEFSGQVLGIGRRMLHALRQVLERDMGDQAAAALQEAGYAAGDQVYDSFQQWLAKETGLDDPADLDAQYLDEVLARFFSSLGWGTVTLERIGTGGLAIDASDWAESEPGANALAPGCHVTAGLLAGFLGRIAASDIAVMEMECRTRNDSHCRFLAGAPETLQMVYAAAAEGRDYRTVLSG
jgi:predicted hydrocarbon binding protein